MKNTEKKNDLVLVLCSACEREGSGMFRKQVPQFLSYVNSYPAKVITFERDMFTGKIIDKLTEVYLCEEHYQEITGTKSPEARRKAKLN